ncbi:SDR family NAD(P)-dependent oxidoreductase [Photobacterium rosenbergii]|uniref:SDR family NAD(P)-dependent oxidoreductase n=1 Tax=Photobacterium rosenbergii TaxID=294936 RepID=UPI001C994FE2|nr:SDR family NAD(P)-dependent oxidoreductase [Photobacterium rosenbergii]MBY5946867.1 SDR family NAD(P)-dependent oxidoreductase [Photobacterium rosenbergii]
MSQPVAIITGANRGLGKETSRQLASLGYKVFVTARKLESAQQTVEDLGSKNLIPAQLDITDADSVGRFVHFVNREAQSVDVLINNAAIHYDTWQNVVDADLETVQQAMDTNVFGAWRMVQALLPLLRQSPKARIVNVSSGAGALHNMGGSTPAYSMSKIALNALTLMLANQLGQEGILVNAVCPGWVATDMGGTGGRPIEEGAKGIVWAATMDQDGPSGGFFRDGQRIDW